MKVVLILLVVVTYVAAGKITTKYDNIDIDSILRSDRLRQNYINCLLDKGKCTPDAKTLKEVLPSALEDGCGECNEKQKAGSDKVIRFLVNERPAEWDELSKKFDPDNQYKHKFQDEARKYGIPDV